MNIPVVVVAYDRPMALSRLLRALQKTEYPDPVQLIISIDGGGNPEVLKVAEAYEWRFGAKEIIHHKENLGLRRHIISCGDIALEYEGVIILEDDLYVSPQFYNYVRLATNYYNKDDAIAGIALYAHSYNETAGFPFYPFQDGSDVFFMQLACSWGQCWSSNQWARFKNWLNETEKNSFTAGNPVVLPGDIACFWSEFSWKKYFTRYMIEQNLFFVYPRASYTTNFGDKGQHQNNLKNYQVPLQFGRKTPSLVKLIDSRAVYDAFCEMIPDCLSQMCPQLKPYDYCVDLFGAKLIADVASEYILTPKQNRRALLSFGKKLLPVEANIIEKIEGNQLFLAETKDCLAVDSFIKQRDMFWNNNEEILYHYKLPLRYIEKLNNDPVRFLILLLKSYRKRLGKWITSLLFFY
ncbi:MAG: glycosyl transferase family 2 [Desulfobacteraceae bacterium]|nr:MAG: glycosyl transferase family 2 [Desulfobacteraceae bacterium]